MVSVATFDIQYTQFLDENARVTQTLPEFAQQPETLIALFTAMVQTRIFDNKAIALQRTGKLGTYPSSLGQEAISIGMGSAMQADDVFFPYYRECGAQLLRDVSMTEILLYWGGDERGMDFKNQAEDFPVCVPIASQGPHAVGAAYAMKLRKQKRAAVTICGDGATSKGDFYESINAAGIYNLPIVFVINNNQWAISVRREYQTGAETIAQKAIAAGFSGEQVDGNDVIAVHNAVNVALEKARNGGGPSLIEALSYRLCDHTTADDASRYRSDDEMTENWKKEPVDRLKKYLMAQGFWDEDKQVALEQQCSSKVESAVKAYLDTPPMPPEQIFDYMYAELPQDLEKQKIAFIKRKKQQNDQGEK